MSETRQVFDPFDSKTVEIRNDLTLRLRGKYAIGPTLPNGEPEFGWSTYPAPAIQQEAAAAIDHMRAGLATIADIAEGSTTANSLPHIAKLARALISGEGRDG